MMSIGTAWREGLERCRKYWRIGLWWYLLSLLLAVVVAWPLRGWLESKVGHSLMVKDMLQGLDYTFLNDFMNAYGSGAGMIFNQSLLVLLIFVLLSAFLMGGLLGSFQSYPEAFRGPLFWSRSGHFFWRMLRLAVYFLLIQGLVLVIFGLIFLFFTKGLSADRLASEVVVVRTAQIMVPIYLLVAALVKLWQDYAKIALVQKDPDWLFGPLRESGGFLRRHFGKAVGLYFLNLLLLALVFLLFWGLSHWTGSGTKAGILLSFLLSQLLLIMRLWWRLLHLGAAQALFQGPGR